jgi:hypothetical protein
MHEGPPHDPLKGLGGLRGRGAGAQWLTSLRIARSRINSVSEMRSSEASGEAVLSTTFVDQDGRTTTTVTCTYGSQPVRDAIIASGVERGAGESYDRPADLLRSKR